MWHDKTRPRTRRVVGPRHTRSVMTRVPFVRVVLLISPSVDDVLRCSVGVHHGLSCAVNGVMHWVGHEGVPLRHVLCRRLAWNLNIRTRRVQDLLANLCLDKGGRSLFAHHAVNIVALIEGIMMKRVRIVSVGKLVRYAVAVTTSQRHNVTGTSR